MTSGPANQKCDGCGVQFPEGKRFVAPFIIEDSTPENLCSVCALHKTRIVHNNPDYYFQTKANRKRHRRTVEFLISKGKHVPDELKVQSFEHPDNTGRLF